MGSSRLCYPESFFYFYCPLVENLQLFLRDKIFHRHIVYNHIDNSSGTWAGKIFLSLILDYNLRGRLVLDLIFHDYILNVRENQISEVGISYRQRNIMRVLN